MFPAPTGFCTNQTERVNFRGLIAENRVRTYICGVMPICEVYIGHE